MLVKTISRFLLRWTDLLTIHLVRSGSGLVNSNDTLTTTSCEASTSYLDICQLDIVLVGILFVDCYVTDYGYASEM